MKLINKNTLLLKEAEWKPKKAKKGEPEPPASNPNVVGEAEVVLSLDERLKKGDTVLINRTGLLDIPVGKTKYVILDIEDVLLKI
jgi:hypothetical protein